jgi:hypothetical protein
MRPSVRQVLSTPMHLLGLGYYNAPQSSFASKVDVMRLHLQKSVLARMARIAPAFGFGGIGNKAIREGYREWLNGEKTQPVIARASPTVMMRMPTKVA